MTNLKKRLELARLLRMFAETEAEDGTLFVYEGSLEVGTNVYTPNEEGELVPVADGTYKVEGKTVEVKDGTITEVKEETVVEEVEEVFAETEEPTKEEDFMETPAEEVKTSVEEELRARIAELEAELAEKDARIAELEAELVKANEPAESPVEEKFSKVDEHENFNLRQYVKQIKNK